MRRLLAISIPLMLLLSVLGGCKESDADKPIVIGHIYSPEHADDEVSAVILAVDELNADPTRLPLGRRIQIRHAPGGTKPEQWGAQAKRLISINNISGLIAGCSAEDAEKIALATQGDGTVALTTAGWTTSTSSNSFTVGLSPSERGRALAEFAKEKKPASVLVIREPARMSAMHAADRFLSEMRSAGIKVAEVDASTTDKPAADAVFFACSASVAIKHSPKNALRLFGDDPDLLLATGTAADGIHVAASWHPDMANPRWTAFVERFRRSTGRTPTGDGILAHDALSIWVEAAKRANSLDAASIRSELLKHDKPFESLTGPLTFADDRSARRQIFVGRIGEGQLRDMKETPPAK